jgi:hypothetical protein
MLMTEKDKMKAQRTGAIRTAWQLAAVAVLIFLAFILSGVLGH